VAGRIRTCGAPRFKRPLYRAELRPLGYQHLVSSGFAAAHTTRPATASQKKGAHGGNMVSPVKASEAKPSGRGWTRTSSLLFVRQALSALELLAQVRLRDKDSNLDIHVQSVASSPVRRSRIGTGRCPPSTPRVRGRRSA
jgi:hypothetical protein